MLNDNDTTTIDPERTRARAADLFARMGALLAPLAELAADWVELDREATTLEAAFPGFSDEFIDEMLTDLGMADLYRRGRLVGLIDGADSVPAGNFEAEAATTFGTA